MQDREAKDVHQALRRYEQAVEQLQRVAHYLDPAVHGRAPTATELDEIKTRRRAKEDALRKVCAWPCATATELRSKAKVLIGILDGGETLSGRDQRALVQSILQMPKGSSTL